MRKTLIGFLFVSIASSAFAQSGNGYNLEQNVIGNGGWKSQGGSFTVLGTMGQSNAGSTAAGGLFHLIDGLWAIENPIAVSPFASVEGTVSTARGVGIVRALIIITNQTTNLSYQTWTEPFGYFRFPAVSTGASYVITVRHPHFVFEPNVLVLFISQDRSNVNFLAAQ